METWIELRTSCPDAMLSYQLSHVVKLLGNFKFNHLTIILTYKQRIGAKLPFFLVGLTIYEERCKENCVILCFMQQATV